MFIVTRLLLPSSIALLLCGPVPACNAADTIGDKVVQFCSDNLGEKVGDGQCAALAIAAVSQAGGKPLSAFTPSPGKDDYVWGDLVYVLEIKDGAPSEQKVAKDGPQPGDVIQFGGARLEGRIAGGGEYTAEALHHTAVIKAVKKNGAVLAVLEQNWNGKMLVTEGSYRLSDLKAGWIRVYRPVK